MNIKLANLEDLLAFHYEESGASLAVRDMLRAIREQDAQWLHRMLRDYRADPIVDRKELAFRKRFDALISCYSALEVAITSKVIDPPKEGDPFWQVALLVLDHPLARHYYEELHPERLPQYLRVRLLQGRGPVEEEVTVSQGLAFVELDKAFKMELENSAFLRLMDGFVIDGATFDFFAKHLESPKRFVASLLTEPAERDPLDQAAVDLGSFGKFCVRLEKLLEACEDYPLLRAEIWLKYEYWFGIAGKDMEERFGEALRKFTEWEAPEGEAEEIRRYVDEMIEVFERLVDSDYALNADETFGPVQVE